MKRIFCVLCILLPLINCFEDRGDSKLELNLGTPDPSVTRIHVGIYHGEVRQENLLFTEVFDPGTLVNINIPSGPDRIVVIWGETTSGVAEFFGVSAPFNSDSGESSKIFVAMKDFTTQSGFAIDGNYFVWNESGAEYYELTHKHYQYIKSPPLVITRIGPLYTEFFDYGSVPPTPSAGNDEYILESISNTFNLKAQSSLP